MTTQSESSVLNNNCLDHILNMAKSHTVCAAEDIVDSRGTLLLAKGKEVDERLNENLLARKLQRPLETSLVVKDGVNVNWLIEEAKSVFANNHSISAFANAYSKHILKSLAAIRLCPAASLLLTALHDARHHAFTHAVEVAILASAIGIHLDLSEDDLQRLIISGLLHDIGELYINTSYLDLKRALTPAEWKHVAVHPKLSEMAIASFMDYPKSVVSAVAEHHERIDGTGYPRSLSGQDISRNGQILSMAETLSGVLKNRHHPIARATLAVKLIPGEFSAEIINAMVGMRRVSSGGILCEFPGTSEGIEVLIQNTKMISLALSKSFHECESLKSVFLSKSALELSKVVESRLLRLRKSLNAVGLGDYFSENYLDTLSCEGHDEMYLELEVISSEIGWRLRDLAREITIKLESLAEEDKSSFIPLVLCLDRRNEVSEPVVSDKEAIAA